MLSSSSHVAILLLYEMVVIPSVSDDDKSSRSFDASVEGKLFEEACMSCKNNDLLSFCEKDRQTERAKLKHSMKKQESQNFNLKQQFVNLIVLPVTNSQQFCERRMVPDKISPSWVRFLTTSRSSIRSVLED